MFKVANILTGLNLTSGILAILLALAGRLDLCILFIIMAAVFDFLDGFTARLLKQQSELGKQLDSLADMVSFGVAPGIIIMIIMIIDVPYMGFNISPEEIRLDFFRYIDLILNGSINDYTPLIALLIPFFALFRLAKFNLDTRQTDSFIGLPTPAMTLFILSYPLLFLYHDYAPGFMKELTILWFHPIIIITNIILVGLLMVSEVPLFALKLKSFGWKGNELRYSFMLISIGIIILFKSWATPLIVFLYLILSLSIRSKNNTNEI